MNTGEFISTLDLVAALNELARQARKRQREQKLREREQA